MLHADEEDALLCESVLSQRFWNTGEWFGENHGEEVLSPMEPERRSPIVQRGYIANPQHTHYSLWTPTASERALVESIASRQFAFSHHDAPAPHAILRVQNPFLLHVFRGTAGARWVGFHGLYWGLADDVLRRGLRPDLCVSASSARYGFGAYVSRNPAMFQFASVFPARRREPTEQPYVAVLLCCIAADVVLQHTDDSPILAQDAGAHAYGDAAGASWHTLCLQDWRRIYPAYVIVYPYEE